MHHITASDSHSSTTTFIILTYHRELHLPLAYSVAVLEARVVASIVEGDIGDADSEL